MMSRWFEVLEVEHLTKPESNRALVIISMKKNYQQYYKPFKFLNLCIETEVFMDIMRSNWSVEEKNPFL